MIINLVNFICCILTKKISPVIAEVAGNGFTVKLIGSVAVQPLIVEMVMVPVYVPANVPAGTVIPVTLPAPALNTYAVLP